LSAGFKILAYLIGTIVLGATLAPWLFWGGQHASHFKYLGFLATSGFQRFFNRSVLISAFLLLIPLLRSIGLEQLQNLGLRKNPQRISHFLGGFLISACTISALGAGFLWLNVCEFKSPFPLYALPPLLLTAISVALIEEALFRGAILGLIRQTFPTMPAAIFVSALFSIIHFLTPAKEQIVAVSNCCRTRSEGFWTPGWSWVDSRRLPSSGYCWRTRRSAPARSGSRLAFIPD
jgi:membrane protease YdiL (CAAX protease family)